MFPFFWLGSRHGNACTCIGSSLLALSAQSASKIDVWPQDRVQAMPIQCSICAPCLLLLVCCALPYVCAPHGQPIQSRWLIIPAERARTRSLTNWQARPACHPHCFTASSGCQAPAACQPHCFTVSPGCQAPAVCCLQLCRRMCVPPPLLAPEPCTTACVAHPSACTSASILCMAA